MKLMRDKPLMSTGQWEIELKGVCGCMHAWLREYVCVLQN